jgi:hypothetical protein
MTVKPMRSTISTSPPPSAGWMMSLLSWPVTVSQAPNSQTRISAQAGTSRIALS